MNIKLLFLLLPFFGFSQTSISNYDSTSGSTYAIVSSSASLDQSTSGANLTWSFNMLTQIGTTLDEHMTPTAGELITYPGTTSVSVFTRGMNVSKIFTTKTSETVSLTGALGEGLVLNYNTNNALIGTFPLSYGYANTDNVSGNYIYDTYNGTFSGTIQVSVDAYGTLTMNDLGAGGFNGPVTRLKTVQTISLNYIIPDAGTATQISYYYYDDNNGNLVFRTTTATISVPLLSINTSTSIFESLLSSPLGVSNNNLSENRFRIRPNPVKDDLNIIINKEKTLSSIIISDISGRQVLYASSNNRTLKVSQLKPGIYIATIMTNNGIISRKFIKQ